ncbi:hypothetical protein PRUPE_3G132500 [Prunus persica]|uniref:Uncharacterized protein n=1 Tax=Prunus persica TaxID=3760 RepID=A0A251PZJ5_PRUPE|nr:uncharacterized protein LOC18766094 [Prunus persica]ONI16989.1 hypothetical protein PRUPE_3G132500 [Prunus persica]
MVQKLKLASPVKFYGHSLPRPRIYTDVKFNDHRVDPPVAVLDPLLWWANEAHWSMGGLSFKRIRLQGRIEGNVGKLRVQREKTERKRQKLEKSANGSASNQSNSKRAASDSPPPAPIATKRRRFLDLIDEDDEDGNDADEVEHEVEAVKGKRLVKNLADAFDKVAMEGEGGNSLSPSKGLGGESEGIATRTRSRRSEEDEAAETVLKVAEEVNKLSFKDKKLKGKSKGKENKQQTGSSNVNGTRTSPRLANRS